MIFKVNLTRTLLRKRSKLDRVANSSLKDIVSIFGGCRTSTSNFELRCYKFAENQTQVKFYQTCTKGPRTSLMKFGINRHHLDIGSHRSGVSSDCDLEEFTTGIPRNLRNPKDPTSLSKRSVIDFRILRRHILEHLEFYSPKDTLSLPPRPWVLPEPRHHRRRNI